MCDKKLLNLVINLASELGVALEMSYGPEELRELWPEAIESLREARQVIKDEGILSPAVIDNVINLAEE